MNRDLLPDLTQARAEFLATGDESLLPIVDAHHHFWDMRNPHPWLTELPRIPFRYGDYEAICQDFLPADYAAACGAHRVLRHVVMEGEWTPDENINGGPGCTSWCRAYLWIVPAKVDGHWRLGDGTLELKQTFQMLEGSLTRGGQAVAISEAKLRGTEIVFTAGGRRYTGQATGDAMSGQVDGGQWSAVRQPR